LAAVLSAGTASCPQSSGKRGPRWLDRFSLALPQVDLAVGATRHPFGSRPPCSRGPTSRGAQPGGIGSSGASHWGRAVPASAFPLGRGWRPRFSARRRLARSCLGGKTAAPAHDGQITGDLPGSSFSGRPGCRRFLSMIAIGHSPRNRLSRQAHGFLFVNQYFAGLSLGLVVGHARDPPRRRSRGEASERTHRSNSRSGAGWLRSDPVAAGDSLNL